MPILLTFIFVLSSISHGLPKSLQTRSLHDFQIHVKNKQDLNYVKELCQAQIKLKKIPHACLAEWSNEISLHCLKLKLKDVSIEDFRPIERLKSKKDCYQHLKYLKKLFKYRKNHRQKTWLYLKEHNDINSANSLLNRLRV